MKWYSLQTITEYFLVYVAPLQSTALYPAPNISDVFLTLKPQYISYKEEESSLIEDRFVS